jgi:hypothetical protein
MPTTAVRWVGALVVLLGLIMFLNVVLGWGFTQAIFNVFRGLHLIVALAFVGLYEATLARRKRTGTFSIAGRQLGTTGRILVTLVLLLGIYLLLTHLFDALVGYDALIWVHGLLGLVAYGLTEIALSKRRISP